MRFWLFAILCLMLTWTLHGPGMVRASDSPSSPPSTPPAKKKQTLPLPENRLTDSQMNLLKVYEVNLKEQPAPRVTVPSEVMDVLFRDYADSPQLPRGRAEQELWRTKPGLEQLELLFKVKARPLYEQVKVYGDPLSMYRFRQQIHRQVVVNYCGTQQCHGGVRSDRQGGTRAVGNFFVFRQKPLDDVTAYTNHLLLTQYVAPDTGLRMLNHDRPEMSLLLQYALPWSEATDRHPKGHGWNPLYSNMQDRDFQLVVQWIKMLQSRSYPIDYSVKFEPVATDSQPASQPSVSSEPSDAH